MLAGAFFLAMLGSLIWLSVSLLKPTKIIGVHTEQVGDYYSQYLVIQNPPLSESRMIKWWKENKGFLKDRYGIPKTMKDGSFVLTIWNYRKGYQEYREGKLFDFPNPEPRCFDDMHTNKNCLDKNDQLIRITRNRNGKTFIYTDSASFIESDEGALIKLR